MVRKRQLHQMVPSSGPLSSDIKKTWWPKPSLQGEEGGGGRRERGTLHLAVLCPLQISGS